MKKRVLALTLCVVMSLALLAGCGNGDTTSSPPPSSSSPSSSTPASPSNSGAGSHESSTPEAEAKLAEHIEVILDVAITVMNPFILAGNANANLYQMFSTHDRLIVPADDGQFGPQLATSWETKDGQTYVFNLRNDVYFHNGDHFTARDVEFTIEESRNYPGTVGYDRWSRVKTINVLDDYKIELILNEVQVEWLATISAATASIFNERTFKENPDDSNWTKIGTGPYKVVDFFSGDYVTIERTDDYWGDDYPTKSVTFRGVPEPSARLMMLESGEADVVFSINPQEMTRLKGNSKYVINSVCANIPHVLGFNMSDPLMSNLDFRLAVMHALDYEDIAFVAHGEWAATPDHGSLWGYAIPFCNTELPRRQRDLELAKKHLEASPYNGETIELATTTDANIRAAELIQIQLAEINLNVNVAAMESTALMERVSYENNTSQMHIFFLAFVNTPVYSNYAVFYPGFFANRLSYDDPVVTDLIDRGFAEHDADRRKAIVFEMQEYIYNDPPAVTLFYSVTAYAAQTGVGGISFPSDTVYTNFRGMYRELS